MEVTVIKNYTSRSVCISYGEIIIEYKLKGRIADEITFHLYAPINRRVNHVAWRVKEDIYFLVDIDKNIVTTVFAVDWYRRSWRVYGTWAENRKIANLFDIQDATFGICDHLTGNQWFDMWCISELWVSKIDDFV